MWHGCAGRLQGAANVTTTRLCASRHASLRGSLCRGPCSSRAPLQLTTLHCTNNKIKWIPVGHVRQGQLMSQGKSKTAHWFWNFTRNLQFKSSGKLGSHAFQFVECVCPDAFATTPIAEKKCTKDFSKTPCQSVAGGSQGSFLRIHNSDKGRRLLTHNSVICDPIFLAGKRKEQAVRGSTAELSKKRARARLSSYKETDASDLLMRFSFNIQCQLRVRKLRLGSQRKAKHLHRISTFRGKRLKTEVRFFLSRPSAESENLTKQVNGEELLKLRSRSQVPAPRDGVESVAVETMVQERAGSEEPSPAHGRTSARKRTPKSCDCCGTNCKLPAAKAHRAKKSEHQSHTPRKRGRKRKVPEAELELEAELEPEVELDCEAQAAGDAPASDDEPAQVNGTASPSSEPGGDVEVEPPVSYLEPCTNPLRDHHYCKTEGVRDDCTAGLEAEQHLPRDQLTAADIHEEMTELIHEFLENFYGKYGSFIPLSETDVLEHLNGKFGTDLTDRKTSICTEVTKYQAGLASAPMHCFKVAYNKHTLTLDDLSTLDEQNWLNDQVINMYGELIMDAVNHKVHFFNSFFHRQLVAKGYEGVKRWTKKVDLFTKNLLLIPIHLEIHWSLITVDICNQQVNFYDSQGITFKHAVDNILRYILAEAKEKQQALYQKGWKVIVNKSIPQQKNDSDCGVFVLEYCKCLALKEPLQFTQEDMPKVRKRIYKELCERKLKTEVVSV